MLIARKSYPLFYDPANPATYTGPDSMGIVVAAYKISSHFDIQRAYNASTGEEQNVIEENTTDKPWYARQFMRVDWSSNEVTDPMWMDMFIGKAYGDIVVSPLVYNVTDPTSEEAPHFEPNDGYFDITNRFYIESAASIRLDGAKRSRPASCTDSHGERHVRMRSAGGHRPLLLLEGRPEPRFRALDNTKASLDLLGNPGGAGKQCGGWSCHGAAAGLDPPTGSSTRTFTARQHSQTSGKQPLGCAVRHRRPVRHFERLSLRHVRKEVHDAVSAAKIKTVATG